MNPDNKPQAEQLLDSLINCVLLLDNDLIIRYANQSAMQLFAQSARKLTGTPLPILYSYLSLDTATLQATLAEGHSFTDNDVTLVVNNQMHALSLSAQPVSGDFILLELTPLDSHRRITQEQLQQAQQAAARDLVRGLAHEIKNPLGGLRGAAQLLSRALPDPALQEYTQVIIEQADRLRALVDRLRPSASGRKVCRAFTMWRSAFFSSSIWKNRTISRWLKTTIPVCRSCRIIPTRSSRLSSILCAMPWKPCIPQAAPLFCAPAPHSR